MNIVKQILSYSLFRSPPRPLQASERIKGGSFVLNPALYLDLGRRIYPLPWTSPGSRLEDLLAKWTPQTPPKHLDTSRDSRLDLKSKLPSCELGPTWANTPADCKTQLGSARLCLFLGPFLASSKWAPKPPDTTWDLKASLLISIPHLGASVLHDMKSVAFTRVSSLVSVGEVSLTRNGQTKIPDIEEG